MYPEDNESWGRSVSSAEYIDNVNQVSFEDVNNGDLLLTLHASRTLLSS